VPLFEGIISDLFPGVESPQPDFGVFLEALTDNIAKRKLQPVPWFIHKIIQVDFSLNSQFTDITALIAQFSKNGEFTYIVPYKSISSLPRPVHSLLQVPFEVLKCFISSNRTEL